MNSVELLHPDLPELLDELLARKGWSWELVANGRAEMNGQKVTLDDLQWFLVQTDPVLWTECNLVERQEDGGGLWRLFDYQKPSARFRGHVVHQDGAEVGKSREIVALTLWTLVAREKGSVLVGSARDGDLDEIWDEIEWQQSANPYIGQRVTRRTTKPYRRLTMDNGLKALFRPAGYDGQAFRGIHVRGLALHDEAVKVENPTAWREFWRATKPGCEIRIYSVPNGNRQVTFQRIADNAIPSERVVPPTSPASTIEQILSSPAEARAATKKLSRDLGGRKWVRFHWPKTIMPAPFWSEDRREEFIGLFGSAEDPGYIHNVLGLPGDPESSVFPSRLLDPNVRFVADYLTISIVWDHRSNKVDILARRLNPSYSREDGAEDSDDDEAAEGGVQPAYLTVLKTSREVEGNTPDERAALVADIVTTIVRPLSGRLTGGVDFASASVTEVLVGDEITGEIRLRLSASGLDYAMQASMLRALDSILRPGGGWGMDATGVGRAVVDILEAGGDDFARRISGFVFNRKTEALNRIGEPMLDPHSGDPVTLSYKEWGTQLLEKALAWAGYVVPADPELIFLLQNHTFRETANGRAYRKQDDHVADAWRCLALRRQMAVYGAAVSAPPLIVLSTGQPMSSAALLKM